jgi:hypothetical protein
MKIMLSRKNYNRVMHAIDVADKVCEGLTMFFVLFMIMFGFPFVAFLLAP